MPLKDILVHMDPSPAALGRLACAAALARVHDACVSALHVVEVPLPPITGYEGAAVLGELLDRQREAALAEAARISAAATELLQREVVRFEWRQPEGLTVEQVARQGRHADLVVVGQPPAEGDAATAEVLGAALFNTGRPVLVVPSRGRFERPFEHVLVGWNGSREAARATHDALPLMARARAVTVYCANPGMGFAGQRELPGSEIAAHLARHGLNVEVEHASEPSMQDGEMLLARAVETGADLLVIGGYGHARWREALFGGVTRHLLDRATVPVLMAH